MKGRNTFACKYCGQMIYVTDSMLSKNNKKVPINADNDTPHTCLEKKSEPFPCRDCGNLIYFDPEKRASSGKKIPLDAQTQQGHECPAKGNTT